MKPSHLLTLLVFTLIFSCKNDDDNSLSDTNPNPNPEVFTENFGSDINRDFLGEVVDQNNNPIQNATVTIGDQTTLTDANGVFIIRGANIYERFGYVKVEKAGYIYGSRSVVPTTGTNKVKIMLLEETIVGTTASGTSETISLSNGASVALEGEYIKEDGSAYSGTVNVIMHHLDPSDENMSNQMPGMLYAANAQNEERMLQTFGMLAVELRGSNGEDLNLATGSTAEITVPLDASLVATAPATIPLWYFDEVAGYWKEEGEATLVGNTYVGTVSHFSFWNCDIPFDAVTLCVNISNENGDPLSYATVWLSSTNSGNAVGFTNSTGEVCGFIPANDNLTIEVFPSSIGNTCDGGSIYSSVIGPFSQDSSYEIQITDYGSYIFESVNGLFLTCDEEPVTSGYAALNYNGAEITDFVDDGNFNMSLLRCNDNNTFHLQAYDFVNVQQTDSIAYTFTTPITNIGSLSACNDVSEFITYQVDNDESITYIFSVQAWLDGPNYLYTGYNMQGSNNNFSIYLGDNSSPLSIGTYSDPSQLLLVFSDENYMSDPNGISTNIELNLSHLGDAGEYIDMNFTGTFIDANTNVEHNISGTIHVIRDY